MITLCTQLAIQQKALRIQYTPYKYLLKNDNYSIKTANDYIHISLNSQFTVNLNGIICFSVWLCDNLLLLLKMRFQVFFLQTKRYQSFLVTEKYYCRYYQWSFVYKAVSQIFEILILSQNIWGKVHYVLEINLIF